MVIVQGKHALSYQFLFCSTREEACDLENEILAEYGCVIHCNLKLFSSLMISWLCLFYSSFMKLQNF